MVKYHAAQKVNAPMKFVVRTTYMSDIRFFSMSAPVTAGKISSPRADAMLNRDAIRLVTESHCSAKRNPVANMEARPTPSSADPT